METSKPWPGTVTGDAGPYNSNSWNDSWGALARASVADGRSADYNIGVFYAIANHLDTAINGSNVDVDTGASLIDGLYHENDATVSVAINTPSVNPRIDYIVVRKNYQQAVTYTPAGAGPTVGPRTARITVIRGTEAASPVAPSLTQDTTRTTYWDIPIATVQISTGGVLSNLTDAREYIDAEIKSMWVTTTGGEDEDTNTDIIAGGGTLGDRYFLELPDAVTARGMGTFIVPQDFISSMTITAVVMALANGDVAVIESDTKVSYGQCNENYANHINTLGAGISAITLVSGNRECIAEISMTNASIGDMAIVEFNRDGSSVLDTINNIVGLHGWHVQYLGWKK